MLHLTEINSGRAKDSERGEVPGGSALFHSRLFVARGWMLCAVVSSFTICTGWPVCNTTMCGANRHPFCTNCTGWLGVEDSSGAPAEMYTTTFSSAFPCPTTRSSLFGGVEYIFAQPGSAAMLIVLAITVTPSTVTLPPMPAACAVESIVKKSAAMGIKNRMRCVLMCIFSYEFSDILDVAANCPFQRAPGSPALKGIKAR